MESGKYKAELGVNIASLHSEAEKKTVKEIETLDEILKDNVVYKDVSYRYRYISALASGSLNDSA